MFIPLVSMTLDILSTFYLSLVQKIQCFKESGLEPIAFNLNFHQMKFQPFVTFVPCFAMCFFPVKFLISMYTADGF